ncbi:hypothetical protein GCM10010869_16560 [Mesorhizobium tianshanense]|uniref:Uncharacterized protein n=1 Tax=Mesorhizobium tianshanense TaxID=39844 RepID=A0A562NWC1_9HYPH|nr:hypothetical protein [Mesorhizobium tianshanense]TWI36393.1 hypothetical protein IQ26_02906 [Mesorhizobium tianshanense]GLS36067.1 hypothetical protein GCM10010869_16560 [Mesorhizobium tianshanense]
MTSEDQQERENRLRVIAELRKYCLAKSPHGDGYALISDYSGLALFGGDEEDLRHYTYDASLDEIEAWLRLAETGRV